MYSPFNIPGQALVTLFSASDDSSLVGCASLIPNILKECGAFKIKAPQSFKTSSNAHPIKQCHILQDLNPQQKHSTIIFISVRREATENKTANPDSTPIV